MSYNPMSLNPPYRPGAEWSGAHDFELDMGDDETVRQLYANGVAFPVEYAMSILAESSRDLDATMDFPTVTVTCDVEVEDGELRNVTNVAFGTYGEDKKYHAFPLHGGDMHEKKREAIIERYMLAHTETWQGDE